MTSLRRAGPGWEAPGSSVLIVGINYWPEETGVAPYTTALAEHLASSGYAVTVMTGMPHYPHWRVGSEYRRRLRAQEERHGVRVLRFRHYVPARQSALRRGLYELTFFVNALATVRLARPDAILGIVPSLGGGVLAAALARRYRSPYGLLFQDLMGNAASQSGVPGGGRVAELVRFLEKAIGRRAAAVGVVAEGFRPYLEALGVEADRLTHVPNWTHVAAPSALREAIRAGLGWDRDLPVVLHAGNMGIKQGLEHVLAAARCAAARGSRVRFVLMGDGSQRRMLEAAARGCSLVTFLDPQPAERFSDVLAAADVLLVNERRSILDMSIPSKLTSYFVAGRPVVAAVAPDGVTAGEIRRAGAGVVVPAEDPLALLEAIERVLADPQLSVQLGRSGAAYAREHLTAQAGLTRAEQFVAGLIGAANSTAEAGTFTGWNEQL